jgi:hypothetical protein
MELGIFLKGIWYVPVFIYLVLIFTGISEGSTINSTRRGSK